MNYDKYRQERNLSWEVLIDCQISSLPVNLSAICKHYNVRIIKNSNLKSNKLQENERGKSCIINNNRIIIVRDDEPVKVQRYTIAHEIRHFLSNDGIEERQAERFAIGILAPSCVLWALNIHEPEEIAKLCNISIAAAKIKAERMDLLYKRGRNFYSQRVTLAFFYQR